MAKIISLDCGADIEVIWRGETHSLQRFEAVMAGL
jgi:hypothetical protein